MPYFKNSNGKLFWLDQGDDPAIWLPDYTPVSDAEAELLRPQQPELTYAQKRVAEYPPVTDYIDGVVKGDQAQIDAYIAACLAVKAKYPKPEQ
jgi:hypothetical protein